MKKNVLIIGAGGVAKVVAHKCAQHNDELGRIAIASRNISKCQAIIDSVKAKGSLKQPAEIQAFALNAPALVWVPHGDVPSPWDLIMMPKVRGQ